MVIVNFYKIKDKVYNFASKCLIYETFFLTFLEKYEIKKIKNYKNKVTNDSLVD